MNTDVLSGKWKQMRGEVKQRWGRLTDDDLQKIGGRLDQLIGRIQERYGYSREKATQEVESFLDPYNVRLQRAAEAMPAKVNQTISEYPWVVLAVILGFVILLIFLLKQER